VISDYLRSLANDPEDEEEEEDIIMEEDELPQMAPRKQRAAVMAAKFEVPKDWSPPNNPKDDASASFLSETMATNKLMKALAPSDREVLVNAFHKVEFQQGDTIIKQGDTGDNMEFYVLESGTADISVAGKGSVMKATKGVSFGELALLHNAPRAATVVADEAVGAFALDMITFKMILMGKSQTDSKDYTEFLKAIPLLKQSGLTDEKLSNLSHLLKEAEYAEGKNIIVEGDEGNSFYIIREGEVKCCKAGQGEVSKRLGRGAFFGELALLSSDKRQATVTATRKTSVLMLGRVEFERLLGGVSDLIAAEAKAAQERT